jgi:bacteriocin-like protein
LGKFENLLEKKITELTTKDLKQIKGGGGDPPPWKGKK